MGIRNMPGVGNRLYIYIGEIRTDQRVSPGYSEIMPIIEKRLYQRKMQYVW